MFGPEWTKKVPWAASSQEDDDGLAAPERSDDPPRLGSRGQPTPSPRRRSQSAEQRRPPERDDDGSATGPAEAVRPDRRAEPSPRPPGVGLPQADALRARSATAPRPESKKPRERDVFEVASMVFGAIIVFFGLWGAIATVGGGVGSAGFVVSMLFVALGAGRIVFGFRGH